jgi:glycosyltransferase involved in cell wall biosynthesis
VARAVQHASGLPWVADFRDPWFALHLHPAPSRWHRWRHSVLERQVLTQASAVLATTRWLGELLQQRGAPAARVHVIRNGFDPEDFSRPSEEAGNSVPAVAATPDPAAPLHLLHTGMLTLSRSATGLLQGLHALLREHPEYRESFRVELIGARESANDAWIDALGLRHCVHVRGYVSHDAAIAAMQRADVLLLIKHTEERFRGLIPGKLYEYLGARRPVLALVPESEAAEIVRQTACGVVVAPQDAMEIGRCLEQLLRRKRDGTLQSTYACRDLQSYDRRQQAGVLAAILDRLVADGAPMEVT